MKNNWIIPTIGLTSLVASSSLFAGVQTIIPSQNEFILSQEGDVVEFLVTYDASSPSDTTGLGLKLFYDSSMVAFSEVTEVFSNSKLAHSIETDSSDIDGRNDTDKFFNIAWASLSGGWPGSGSINLFKIKFIATQDFNDFSTIDLLGEAAAGHTFSPTFPRLITLDFNDITPPVITPPTNVITVEATGPTTNVELSPDFNPAVSDNSNGTVSLDYSPQDPFAVGDHTITWTAIDSQNNTSTATQTLSIVDTVAPQITAPGNITTVATGALTAVTLGTPSIIEAVDTNPTVIPDKTGSFAFGTHTIIWTATDASGNSSTATQTVTITDPGAATLALPANVTEEATGATTSVNFGTVTGTDIIDGNLVAVPSQTGPFTVGEHNITWTVTNSRGTKTTATQTLTIVDTTAPVISAPPSKTVSATGAQTTVAIGEATASDLVTELVAITSDAPVTFPVGETTVTWTATDAKGNSSTATQIITVSDSEGPIITAPVNQTLEATAPLTPVTLGTATATDIVDGTLTATPDKTGPFAIGTHTITWTATDASNNTSTATQTITIEDTIAPVIVFDSESDRERIVEANTPVAFDPVIATDVSGTATLTADNPIPATFPVSRHEIIWTATDASGNTSSTTQVVISVDTGNPEVTAPADQTVEATAPLTVVQLGSATATDLVDETITATADNTGPFALGAHTITWTATDASGNTDTATQTITIVDTTGPAITAPPSATVAATGAETTVNIGTATATDLVDGSVTVTSDAPATFPVGSTTITWTATDAKGNPSTVTQTITVSDSDGPSITAPANQTIEATAELTPVSLGAATAADVVDGTLTATADNTGPFALGTHTITWTATDSSNNTATATQTIIVQDTTAPAITAPADQSVSATGQQTAVTLGAPTVSDAADSSPTITASQSGPFGVGTHTITWTATDVTGNSSTATQTITVTDTGEPTVTAPANITKEATGATTVVSLGSATATDLVDGSLTATADQTGPFAVGAHTITWSVTDASGNTSTDTQTVTVVDTTGPAITAPPSATVAATGAETTVNIGSATATDLVDGSVTVTSDAPATFPVGSTTITWTATDAKGNPSTVTQTITVSDSDGPSITAPANQTIEATAELTPVSLGAATAADVVDGTLTATADNTGPFALGTHTITWTATDSSNNTATATQTIIVQDTTAPAITAPADQSVSATGQQTAVTLGAPTVSDAADSSPTITASQSGPFGVGTHTITWTATDVTGNSSTATQTITVTDTGEPTVTAPANITKEATGATTVVSLGSATATDLVDGSLTATADQTGPFAVGVHTITWSATDSGSHTATATQTVTITDTTPPSLQAPGALTVSATGETTEVTLGAATATDLVDGTVTVTNNAPDAFPIGATTVTYTATDAKGNTATATQVVTVSDGEGPAITAPADITAEATGTTTTVSLGTATATDSVDGDLTATADNEGPFAVGIHTITWTAIDSTGNEATATQTITVEDTTAPEITIGSEILQLNATGVQTTIADFSVTSTDLVDSSVTPTGFLVVNGVEQALSASGLTSGTHQLVWKATDSAGNTSSVQQTVEITPLANFVATQAASAGDAVTVGVALSGEAVSYPVSIPYSIDTTASTVANDGSDHDASNGAITIASGTTGSFTFNVAANPALSGTGQGDLIFTMGTLANAATGSATTHKVTLSADNIAPVLNVNMVQGQGADAVQITKVTKDAGNVLITAVATDSAAQTLSYDWSQSDSALGDLATDSNDATFELDPSSLAEGTYTVVVAVRDNGSPLKETTLSTSFKVVAGTTAVADSDGDGVEDSQDNVPETNRLAEDAGGTDTYIMESEPGTTLSLGAVALEQDQNAAGIDTTGLPEIPAEFEDTTVEIYDFQISGVASGESTLIVIPQHNSIPANATYLKTDGTTWRAFAEDANNIVYSATGSNNGVCPATGDSSYTLGLTEGDYCVQLKIEDGGANDTDGLVNGTVADPGAVVGPANTGTTTTTSSGGGGSMPWFLMPFLILLGLVRRGLFNRK